MSGHPKAKRAGSVHRMGRTTDRVICGACGYTNIFFRWSWAGNGKAKCKGPDCGRWIMYANLNVEDTAPIPAPPRPPIDIGDGS